jgi:hypothetical protein
MQKIPTGGRDFSSIYYLFDVILAAAAVHTWENGTPCCAAAAPTSSYSGFLLTIHTRRPT